MLDYFNNLLLAFNISDENTKIIILSIMLAYIFNLIIRIILALGYQSQIAMFSLAAKEIKDKKDLKDVKTGVLGKVMKDYIRISEKGVSKIDTESLVHKNILNLSFFFWNFKSMESFVKIFEQSLLFVGIILALFMENPMLYGVITLIVFLVSILFAAIFDFNVSKERLKNQIIEYIDREAGQFYILDFSSSISHLKLEMIQATSNQAEMLTATIDKLGIDLTGVLRLATSEISKSVGDTIKTITGYGDVLKEPMMQWKETLEISSLSQQKINETTDKFHQSIEQLKLLIDEIKENNVSVLSQSDSIKASLDYIEKNQITLDKSLVKYDLALENITGKIGDALGSILEYHIERSYNVLNENLEENIKTTLNSNKELILKLQSLFEQMQDQQKSESQAILNIKEQMDMHFEDLKKN